MARYFSLVDAREPLHDIAWSYEDPYAEHIGLRGRITFHDERFSGIAITR